jgi:hypothetical protein
MGLVKLKCSNELIKKLCASCFNASCGLLLHKARIKVNGPISCVSDVWILYVMTGVSVFAASVNIFITDSQCSFIMARSGSSSSDKAMLPGSACSMLITYLSTVTYALDLHEKGIIITLSGIITRDCAYAGFRHLRIHVQALFIR